MSLINDALKKAQRDRTGGPAPEVPVPGGGPRPTESYRTPRSTSTYLLLGGGALIGLVVAIVTVFILRPASPEKSATAPVAAHSEPVPAKPAPEMPSAPKAEPASTPAAPVVATSPAPSPVVVASSEPAASKRTVEPLALNITTPAASAPTTSSTATPPAAQGEPARVAPAVAAPTTPAVATAPAAPPAPPPDPRVLQKQLADLVEGFRVTGIRAAGNDGRVLMNDRVFRVGDIVDRKHGVTLTGVTANSLTFADSNGQTYTRNF